MAKLERGIRIEKCIPCNGGSFAFGAEYKGTYLYREYLFCTEAEAKYLFRKYIAQRVQEIKAEHAMAERWKPQYAEF